jgi:hypothetical protein
MISLKRTSPISIQLLDSATEEEAGDSLALKIVTLMIAFIAFQIASLLDYDYCQLVKLADK